MKYKKYLLTIIFVSAVGLIIFSPTLAQNSIPTRATTSLGFINQKTLNTGINTAGMISEINGKIITIDSKQMIEASNPPTWKTSIYTVNTSNAIMVIGGRSTSTIANVKIGDVIMVQGTISGKNITASMIRDIPTMKLSTTTSTANKATTNKIALAKNPKAEISSSTKIISSTTPSTNTPPVINTPTQKKPGFWSRFITFIVHLFGF
ncbi:MAG: hypothetical protein WCP24_02460 [bacterium]